MYSWRIWWYYRPADLHAYFTQTSTCKQTGVMPHTPLDSTPCDLACVFDQLHGLPWILCAAVEYSMQSTWLPALWAGDMCCVNLNTHTQQNAWVLEQKRGHEMDVPQHIKVLHFLNACFVYLYFDMILVFDLQEVEVRWLYFYSRRTLEANQDVVTYLGNRPESNPLCFVTIRLFQLNHQ